MLSGSELKELGMVVAAVANRDSLRIAQAIAELLGRAQETVTAEDVRRDFELCHPTRRWGNWAGKIFCDRTKWAFVSLTESTVPSRHRGLIRRWKYMQKGEASETMRWLSNISKDLRYRNEEENEWIKGKIVGLPKASEKYSVRVLQDMGMVGIYEKTRD